VFIIEGELLNQRDVSFIAEAVDTSEVEDIVVVEHYGAGPHQALEQRPRLALARVGIEG
jgi:hypothetical protein